MDGFPLGSKIRFHYVRYRRNTFYNYFVLIFKISLLGSFWRENARGPYREIRTSRQPIRKLYLGYGPGVTERKKIKADILPFPIVLPSQQPQAAFEVLHVPKI